MRIEHILIIRFSAMGDVAMTVPIVYSLAKQYPDVRITMLSQKFARPFFEHAPANVSFMEADLKNEYHGMRGLNALYRRLVAKNFTAIADLHSVLRSSYLRMRFNIDRYKVAHIDKHRAGKRALTRQDGKRLEQQPTSFQNYADVFARLGYPITPDFTSIYPDGKGDESLLPPPFTHKEEGEKWIGVAPFAAHQGKIYPQGQMEQVIALLTEKYPTCRICLFGGGKKENSVMSLWQERWPQCVNASALLGGMAGELVLMSHLDAMLSMDSGNMHLASLVGTPVVSVWGATHPFAGFMGWGQCIDNAVMTDRPCRPCSIYGNKPCAYGDYPCMTSISPQTIVSKLEQLT